MINFQFSNLQRIALGLSLFVPGVTFAAINNLEQLLQQINGLFNIIVPFLIGLAVFLIIWGIFTYVVQAANEEKRKEAAEFIIWGVFAVFMMLSVWGLIALLTGIFQFDSTVDPRDIPRAPQFDQSGSFSNPN